MCEFCEKQLHKKGFEPESPCMVFDENGEHEIYFHGLDEEYYKINYCPMCGRKLVEE